MRISIFLKWGLVFVISICFALPAFSADVKKKCFFKGKRTSVKFGQVVEFEFHADYIVKEGPDTFIGKADFRINDKKSFTYSVQGTVIKGVWTIRMKCTSPNRENYFQDWTGTGTYDKNKKQLIIKGKGVSGCSPTYTDQKDITFEMTGLLN